MRSIRVIREIRGSSSGIKWRLLLVVSAASGEYPAIGHCNLGSADSVRLCFLCTDATYLHDVARFQGVFSPTLAIKRIRRAPFDRIEQCPVKSRDYSASLITAEPHQRVAGFSPRSLLLCLREFVVQ